MNLRQLEAFQAVIDSGTVTGAAAILNVSQPAVSKLIALLARDCGFDLFHRRGNRLVPTAEAMTLYSEVDRMFVSVDHIARHAGRIRDMRSGQLSIAAFPAIATRVLPRIITRFLAAHPDVHVSLSSRSGRLLVDWVAAQQVDLGVGLMSVDHPAVEYVPVGEFDGVCVIHPGHRLAAKQALRARDLEGERFISLGAEDRSRYLVDEIFERERVGRIVVAQAHQSEAACAFAAAGAGVTIVEPFSAAGFSESEIAVRPFRPRVRFKMWLLFPRHRPRSRLTEAFVTAFTRAAGSFARRTGGPALLRG